MSLIHGSISRQQDPLRLGEPLSLTGTSSSAKWPVNNIHRMFDGNPDTFADAATWAAGQGVRIDLGGLVRVGKVRLDAYVYAGPGWGRCVATFGGQSVQTGYLAREAKEWYGDVTATTIHVSEYARTRIYELTVWPLFGTVDPTIPIDELSIAQAEAVQAINTGEDLGNTLVASISDGDFTYESDTTNQQIEFWQAMQLRDPGNGDTEGTLGYFAVSARDFWSEIGNLFDAGEPANAIQEQFALWAEYTASQAGKTFAQMQPVNIWFEAR